MITDKWQLRAIQLLALPGLIISFYLWLYHNGELFIACGGAGGWDDCGLVSGPEGRFSSIGPLPVALIGMIGYVAIFLTVWLGDLLNNFDEYVPEIMAGITGFAFLFSLGLTMLEIFVLNAFCRYCLLSFGIVLIMTLLSLSYLRKTLVSTDSEEAIGDVSVSFAPTDEV